MTVGPEILPLREGLFPLPNLLKSTHSLSTCHMPGIVQTWMPTLPRAVWGEQLASLDTDVIAQGLAASKHCSWC